MLTYELRLGVTGHRDLGDEPEFAHAIKRLLDRIESTLDPRTGVPLAWTVVSALARGADRLFAESVLEEKKGRLEVVTPFSVEHYKRDFRAECDRTEFDRLITRAQWVDELAGDHGAGRERAYLRAGERVVDTSEILVALWDGRPSSGGGTGDVVEYAVRHGRVVLWLDADSPDTPPGLIRSVIYDEDGRLSAGCRAEFPQSAKALSRGYASKPAIVWTPQCRWQCVTRGSQPGATHF